MKSYNSAWASYVTLYVLVNFCGNQAVGLELEPDGVLYACLGGALRVNCNTSAYILEWRIPSDQGEVTRSFQIDGIRRMSRSVSLNSTVLNVSRSLPLISTISTNTTTAGFNGTVITCLERAFNNTILSSASVRIILVGNNGGNVNITPYVNISQWFEVNSITVFLEWTTKNGASYSISVNPKPAINYTERSSAQLSLSYNIKYNISVTASLCGRNSTSFNALNYMTCPEAQSVPGDSVRVSSYRNPAIEGTIITFSCPDGLILTGSNSSVCMENGEWEPELKGMRCKADCKPPMMNSNVSVNYSFTLEDSLLTFQCKDGLFPDDVLTAICYRNRSWIPNPSGHICATHSAANCGEPSPPSDGYLESYTNTSERAMVNIVHVCKDGQLAVEEIVCSSNGEWETVNGSSCFVIIDINSHIYVIIGGSLGSCFGLVLCGVVMTTIIAITRWKGKGSLQRNPTIAKSIERTHQNYEGEYNLLQHSVPRPVFNDNSKGEYSLLQLSDPKSQISAKDQPTTLVYADVISFKQKSHDVLPTENRVEYAQLKEYSGNIFTQQLNSDPSDVKSYSQVDQAINLDVLLIQLKPAITDKWYEFGEAIGVHKEILEECTRYPSDQSLVEILDNWLKNHSGQPTWNEIAEALTKIGLEQLSHDIKSVYETGKLPIEVDMNALHHQSESAEELPPPIPPRLT